MKVKKIVLSCKTLFSRCYIFYNSYLCIYFMKEAFSDICVEIKRALRRRFLPAEDDKRCLWLPIMFYVRPRACLKTFQKY